MNGSSEASDPTAEDPAHDHGRVSQRNNIFVVATLYSRAGSVPVRIRNMSRCGALVEGAVLPAKDEEVELSRGSLRVSGLVAWCDGGKAGLRFSSPIAVAEWLPGGNRAGQQLRVDKIVFDAKGAAPTAIGPARAGPAVGLQPPMDTGEIAVSLLELKNNFDSVAEEFAGDPAVAARFQAELQVLDRAAQKLGTIADTLARR